MTTLIKAEFAYLRQLFTKRVTITALGPAHSNLEKFVLLFSVYLLLDLVLTYLLTWPIYGAFPEIEEAYTALDGFTESQLMLMAVLLAPPLEEFLFRLPLRYSKRNLKIWLVLTALLTLLFSYIISIVLLAFWLYWISQGNNRQIQVHIMRFYKRHGVVIFWFFTMLFALVHLSNFTAGALPVYLFLPAIIPQIITGIALGVIRLRLGFWWALTFHALFNLVVSLLSFS